MKLVFNYKKAVLTIVGTAFFVSMYGVEDSAKFDFSSRFIRAWSITPFSSFNVSPAGVCPLSISSKGYVSPTYTINGIWYHHHFRFNLKEFNSENAIAVNVSPNIGAVAALNFSTDGIGAGHFSLPLYFTYEYGAGSTYSSSADIGYAIGAGIEYNYLPFFLFGDDVNKDAVEYISRSYFVPVLTFTKRKWLESSAGLMANNFKLGILPYKLHNYESGRDEKWVVFSFSFSFGTLLRY